MKMFFLGMFLTFCLSGQSQQCLEIKATLGKEKFEPEEKKEIMFYVKNKTNEKIALPEGLYEGNQEEGNAEFYLEILKKGSKDDYIKVERSNNDYQYILGNRKFKSLKPNEVIKYHTDMDLLHNLKLKGAYKVRVILKQDKFLDCRYLESSSWIEFEIN